jgi:hypothetical protein
MLADTPVQSLPPAFGVDEDASPGQLADPARPSFVRLTSGKSIGGTAKNTAKLRQNAPIRTRGRLIRYDNGVSSGLFQPERNERVLEKVG